MVFFILYIVGGMKPIYKNILIGLVIIAVLAVLAAVFLNKGKKILWLYWDKEQLPHTIQLIKKHNKKNITSWDVRYINNTNIEEYIPRHAYPEKFGDLVSANKSDWIRLYIIYNYGGCWLDMGVIINDGQKFNDMYDNHVKNASELTVFKTVKDDWYFNKSGIRLPLVVDSWYILADRGSRLVKQWLDEFTYATNFGLLNYKRKVLSEGTDLSQIYFKNEEDTYLTVHICIQYILQKKLTVLPKMTIIDSGASMLKLQGLCNWDDKCLANMLLNDPLSKQLPFIKLTSSNRSHNIDGFFL